MIRHQDKRKELPATADHRIFQVPKQLGSIFIVVKNALSCVSTRHHMIDRNLASREVPVNKKQGLTPSTIPIHDAT